MSKNIAGEEYLDRAESAEFVGMALTTFDKYLARSRHGRLRFPLEYYQPGGPHTPLYINRAFLARWVAEVIAAGGWAVITEKEKRKPGRARFWDADKV